MKKVVLPLIILAVIFMGSTEDKPAYKLYDTEGKETNYNNMVEAMKDADIVFFGELHNNPIAHWMQIELTKDLFKVKGADLVLGAEMFEADDQLVIELPQPAAYFLSMSPMWTIAATPQWAIEEYGNAWIEAGNIVTNGRYVLNAWEHGVSWRLLRNPLMPEDMRGVGNIDAREINVVPDTSTGYALWLNNEVDVSGIPDAELMRPSQKGSPIQRFFAHAENRQDYGEHETL